MPNLLSMCQMTVIFLNAVTNLVLHVDEDLFMKDVVNKVVFLEIHYISTKLPHLTVDAT